MCLYEQNAYTTEPGKIQVRNFQVPKLLIMSHIMDVRFFDVRDNIFLIKPVSFQIALFLWRIGTGKNFVMSELSDGNIFLEDWYWYELCKEWAFRLNY